MGELRRGLWSDLYEWSSNYTERSTRLPHKRTLLRGEQKVGYPVSSLRSRRYMEVPRHILTQMVVAGTHAVPLGSGVPFFGRMSPPTPAPMPQPSAFMGEPRPPLPFQGPSPTAPSMMMGGHPPEIDLDPLGVLVRLTNPGT